MICLAPGEDVGNPKPEITSKQGSRNLGVQLQEYYF